MGVLGGRGQGIRGTGIENIVELDFFLLDDDQVRLLKPGPVLMVHFSRLAWNGYWNRDAWRN